ncbi:uncharacterized protein V6R79_016101, partial [Siganus canaliculatus]
MHLHKGEGCNVPVQLKSSISSESSTILCEGSRLSCFSNRRGKNACAKKEEVKCFSQTVAATVQEAAAAAAHYPAWIL